MSLDPKISRPIRFSLEEGLCDPIEGLEGRLVANDPEPKACAICDASVADYVRGPNVFAADLPEYFCLRDFFGSPGFVDIKIGDPS